MTYLFDLILIGMSIFVFVSGILGRGKLFEIDNVKEGREEDFQKGARKIYIVLGLAMLVNSVFSLLLTELYTYDENFQLTVPLYDLGEWAFLTPKLIKGISYGALGIMLVLLVILGVFMSKVTDRNAPPKKKTTTASRSSKNKPVVFPTSAFDFSEEPAAEQAEDKQA